MLPLKQHDVYESLTSAIDDSRVVRHVSYIPAGELSEGNLVITVEKFTQRDFDALVNDEAQYRTYIERK